MGLNVCNVMTLHDTKQNYAVCNHNEYFHDTSYNNKESVYLTCVYIGFEKYMLVE